MGGLAPAERRDIIKDVVDRAKVNWAHVAVAQLISEGYVDRVLTTNFDLLLVRACALVGEFPAMYDFAASPDFQHAQIPEKAVFCLHGQYTGFKLVNTDREGLEQFRRLRPILENTLSGRPVIVAGYSGENDPVLNHLAERDNFEYRLYWIDFQKEPSKHVREKLLERPDKDAHFLGSYDADAFFTELASKLGCFPPAFIKQPFSYLDGLLNRVAPFNRAESSKDFTESTRQRIARAIELLEQGSEDPESHRLAKLSEAEQKLMTGDFGAVSDVLQSAHDPAAANLLAWGHVFEGNALYMQAQRTTDDKAYRLFALAGAKYEAALAIKPDMHEALFNWGNALDEQARRTTGEEAHRLFALAGAKYEAALAIKPDKHEALDAWGGALITQSSTLAGPERSLVLQKAEEVLLRDARIQPDKLYNLACLASLQGKPETCRDRLLHCLKAGTLPDPAYLKSDPDLAAVRDLDWFQEILREAVNRQPA